ncbi:MULTISPECIES: MBL fold metallo-hydrolase [Pigmentiphaga]|uniref:Rv2407 family type 3 sulfatase n=1 Tax=Pigmentiphaga daeguensis TaxID=414049 RepID=A0ABP3LE01_9BURK|nr:MULTISPECIES: MBL fold metallo-hydrolase [unclassified Pigmentiphaga]OVZ65105.1 hypothetical protein CDO46_06815 [Pigmentiphaga sp. NML030171]
MKFPFVFLLAAALASGAPQWAAAADARAERPMAWTTLGTAGGPIIHADRSQPANLLTAGQRVWLVDCGDGALERLAAAGYQPSRVGAVFISHLHQDHVGGLQGVIGLRWMQVAPGTLTIYGPPGTDEVVDGILRSLQPSHLVSAEDVGGGRGARTPADTVRVVILKDGSDVDVEGVRAARNSHFDGPVARIGTESLSLRFDLDGQGIGYTGDTGESAAVARLFKGVELMVSEVIDLDGIVANLNGPASPMPPQVRPALIDHLKKHHLTPAQAGAIAAEAGARRLVFTHLGIAAAFQQSAPALAAGARTTFGGDVFVARDLDRF